MSPKRLAAVSHRRGRTTSFVDRARGKRAPLTELLATAADSSQLERVASAVSLLVRTGRGQRTLPIGEAASLNPADLLPTRRPASYRDMRSFIGQVGVPSEHGPASIWFESLNELSHIRDLVLTRGVLAIASQPMLVCWPLASGWRYHFPDLFLRSADGQLTVCDVTRSPKLTQPKSLAQFVLMAATARRAGWQYEVRTELPAQRVRNVSHVHACRHADPAAASSWLQAVRTGALPQQLRTAAGLAGGPKPNPSAVLHLVATRQLFLDLNSVIAPASLIHEQPIKEDQPWITRLT